MEGSTPPRHRKRSGDSPETPTRPPAFRPDAVRGRGEDPPAEDGIGRPRLRPSRPPLPSLNKTLKTRTRRDPPPPITKKKKKKKMLQAEEEEEKEEKEKEKEAVVARRPSSPKWNLRSRRRPAASAGLPFRALPDRENPLPMRRRSPPTFSLELSKAEIKNDFLRITGKGPRRRPTKRRPRSIQQKLDPLLPGEFLWDARKNWWSDSWEDIF